MDRPSDDPDWTNPECSQDEHQKRDAGDVQLSRLHVWAATLLEEWAVVHGSQAVGQSHRQTQAGGLRSAATQPGGALGGSARSAQREVAWLARLLLLREPTQGVSGDRRLCL